MNVTGGILTGCQTAIKYGVKGHARPRRTHLSVFTRTDGLPALQKLLQDGLYRYFAFVAGAGAGALVGDEGVAGVAGFAVAAAGVCVAMINSEIMEYVASGIIFF